jgi:hypothetical protein
MLLLNKEVINLPTLETPLSPRIAGQPKYEAYFTDCLGALNRTHIDVWLPLEEQARYQNRKGHLS